MKIERQESEVLYKVLIDLDEANIIEEGLKIAFDVVLAALLLRKASIKEVKVYVRGRTYNLFSVRNALLAASRDLLILYPNQRFDRMKIFFDSMCNPNALRDLTNSSRFN